MNVTQIASAVLNNVMDALKGAVSNVAMSIEQLEDEVIAERNNIIKEYFLKGLIGLQELYNSVNCVEVNCDYMSKCCDLPVGKKALHFEIPPILLMNGVSTVNFVGSIDRQESYTVYTDNSYQFHKYRKRKSDSPYVYLDPTINANGNIDGYIFNVPYVKYISVTALFLDPRQLDQFDCCADIDSLTECGILSNDIIHRLSQKKVLYYRQLMLPAQPNTQTVL
jgi:hypothetical protein